MPAAFAEKKLRFAIVEAATIMVTVMRPVIMLGSVIGRPSAGMIVQVTAPKIRLPAGPPRHVIVKILAQIARLSRRQILRRDPYPTADRAITVDPPIKRHAVESSALRDGASLYC